MKTTAGNRDSRSHGSTWVRSNAPFLALLVLFLIPVWVVTYFPSQDGPSHLYNAFIIRNYHRVPFYYEHFVFNPLAFSNWLSHFLLAGFMFLFPPLIAHKLLVSLIYIGTAFSLSYFLRAHSKGPISSALPFLFLNNFCLFMGFYNFSIGSCLFFIVLGLCSGSPRSRRAEISLFALLFLSFFVHVITFCFSLLLVTITFLKGKRGKDRAKGLGVLIPFYLLLLAYGLLSGGGEWKQLAFPFLVHYLAAARFLHFYPGVQDLIPIPFFLLYALLLIKGYRKLSLAEPLALGAFIFLLLYFALPWAIGDTGAYINDRVAALPFILVLPLLCREANAGRVPGKLRGLVPEIIMRGLLVFLIAVSLLAEASILLNYDREIRTRVETRRLEEKRSYLLPSPQEKGEEGALVNPFASLIEYICIETESINPKNYEHRLKNFPLRFRTEKETTSHP